MKLRPVHNQKLGQWKLCHDQWCERGETSTVAVVLTSLDEQKDARLAKLICDNFNAGVESKEAAKAAVLSYRERVLAAIGAERDKCDMDAKGAFNAELWNTGNQLNESVILLESLAIIIEQLPIEDKE
jgi:hypothetical protein